VYRKKGPATNSDPTGLLAVNSNPWSGIEAHLGHSSTCLRAQRGVYLGTMVQAPSWRPRSRLLELQLRGWRSCVVESLPSDSPSEFDGASAPLRVANSYSDQSGGASAPQRVAEFAKNSCSPT